MEVKKNIIVLVHGFLTKKIQNTETAHDIPGLIKGNFYVFEKIYQDFFQRLYEFAYYYLGQDKPSEDIVQDVFLHLWENREKIDPNINLKSYLYTAVKNRSLNTKRHHKVKQKYEELQLLLPTTVEMPDEVLQQKEILTTIEQAINDLPEKRRIIFMMHRFENFTYSQIAQIQNISIKTVETQIKRSVDYIEKKLEQLL